MGAASPFRYGTDTPNLSKRTLQRKVLGRILRNARNRHYGECVALCMPGATCWDSSYLLGHKHVSRVVALERDPDVAEVIRRKHQNDERVSVVESATTEYLLNTEQVFNLIYFDYFSNFNRVVELDLMLTLRRRVLATQGKYVVSIWGARESIASQVRHQMLFETLDDRVPCGERWEDIDHERRRCVAFNALVAGYRYTPIRPSVPQGHPDRQYAFTTAPVWYKYKTAAANMYTGYFTLNSFGRKRGGGAVEACPDAWFVRGKHAPRPVESKNLLSLSRRENGPTHDEWYRAAALAFYARHHYTPTPKDIGKTCVRDWRRIVVSAGLCPRLGATRDQIVGEVRRIHERVGFVRWEHLVQAKIARRPIFKRGRKAAADLCESLGIPCDMRPDSSRRYHASRLERMEAWVAHIEAGRPKTHFSSYGWVVKNGLLNYKDAVVAMRSLRRELGVAA